MSDLPAWFPAEVDAVRGIGLADAAAALLRRCRDQRALLEAVAPQRVALKPPGPKAPSRVQIAARSLVGDARSLQFSRVELTRVCELSESLCAPLVALDDPSGPVLRCRVAAEILDWGWGFRLAYALKARGCAAPTAGDPIPRVRPHPSDLFEGALTTSAARQMEYPIDELRNLGIAKRSGVAFDLDSPADMLPVPHRDLRLAWFDPVSRVRLPGEVRGATDAYVEITVPDGDGQGGRFRVFPADVEANWGQILALLGRVDDDGAEIAVAPELSFGHACVERVRTWLRDAKHLRMVVCGSTHVARTSDGSFVNRATILVRRAGGQQVVELAHDKFNPFDFPIQEVTYVEDIDFGTPRVGTFVVVDPESGHERGPLAWSYAVVICKDLMDAAFADVLHDSQARMLFAPVMTPKTETFAGIIDGLSARYQTVSVLANHDPAAPALIVRRPTIDGPERTDRRPAADKLSAIVFQPFKIHW